MYSYRITKYKYLTRNNTLLSGDSEWSSFFDINKKTTEQEYFATEQKYIDMVLFVINSFSEKVIQVLDLEKNDDNFDLEINEGDLISLELIESLIKAILREKIWCKLKCDKFEFHFGYDYYMYLVSKIDMEKILKNSKIDLFIQEYDSPYI